MLWQIFIVINYRALVLTLKVVAFFSPYDKKIENMVMSEKRND